ncbi:hypothetical protein DFJ43DRAFT_1155405 [Lentinula guzmanii]|uniref:Phosphatidate phosphatase APP1 catalytic domain-containing protein n=1 Tax=Lentinula guzmanii TaxID=2804957 RepID=A0AA38MZ80_9AGAR|nr:hypothetical protein DFJ43DRAFT_1155405 [Lentinula guzmanii]
MKFGLITLIWTAVLITLQTRARPLSRRSTSTLLLNGLGYQTNGDGNVTISIEAFAHLGSKPRGSFTHFLTSIFHKFHADVDNVGDHVATAMKRLDLFLAIGVPLDKMELTINGCDKNTVNLPRTGFKNLGVVTATEMVGKCRSSLPTAKIDSSETVTIYSSPPHGLGIISDIDDTIKITDVLEPGKMFENTAYKDPVPIAGMPELYASLSKSLTVQSIPPQFIYLSGSPFELFPFLSLFLKTHFSASLGPLFLQSLSITDPAEIIKSLGDGKSGQGKIDYKVGQIKRLYGFYPQKGFLAIGDSGEKDPEVYGKAYNEFGGNFIRCIWIHVLDDRKADNSDKRFEEAFKGVPADRIRKFHTSEIPSLQKIDVAGGKCN